MNDRDRADSFEFQAEIRQLLNILVHSLYKDREIFLRELISNASDALTQVQFEMLTNPNVVSPEVDLTIRLASEERDGRKWLIVTDTGIGMSRDELVRNLGTIAQSGARAFLERVEASDTNAGDVIGQFGVGFYSVFMVAEEVRVLSRSYRAEAEPAMWISRGGDSFWVESAEKEDRGTEIHILLSEDAEVFASGWRLREIVKRHSDFVSFPIYFEDEQLNQQEPLWRRLPGDVLEEDYISFYQQMTMDYERPLARVHVHSDAPIHARVLLFVPAGHDRGIFAIRKDTGIKLFSRNIMIQEYNTDLLPPWLDFVDGIVESDDLPLNVSREAIQSSHLMRQLGRTLERRVIKTLEELAEEDEEQYGRFWEQYSRKLKEGIVTDPEAVSRVLPLLRFNSSRQPDRQISLDDYVDRMPGTQEAIYYLLGDSVHSAERSPHLDPFRVRDIEVLYWTDPLDPFIVPHVTEFREVKLQNVDDPSLDLPDLEVDSALTESPLPEPVLNRFVGRCVTTLGDRVAEVRVSHVLQTSPIRLISREGTPNREMDRIYRFVDANYQIPKRVLEVNPRHPLIVRLAQMVSDQPSAPVIDLSIEQLFDSALVQEGLHPEPASMLPRIQELIEIAVTTAGDFSRVGEEKE